jgi:hypothetical protein
MNADVAQWVACSPVTEKVAGSNPSLDEAFLFILLCKKLALITRLVINAAMGNVDYELVINAAMGNGVYRRRWVTS